MKKRILNFFRIAFVSLEFVCLLLIYAAYQYFPIPYFKIGTWYSDNASWVIGVLPNAGFLGYAALQAKEILFPVNKTMGSLREWEDYILLKDAVSMSIIICVIFTVMAFFTLIFKKEIEMKLLGLLFITNLTVPIITIASLFQAQIDIKILLERR